MACPYCEEFRKKYPLIVDEDGLSAHIFEDGISSAPIECAFEDSEKFSTDNWSCETIGFLRQLFWKDDEKCIKIWHNDSNVGVVPIPITDNEEIQQGFLVLSWYKNRGSTGQAMVFLDGEEPKPLTLKTALFIVELLCDVPKGDLIV